MRVIELPQGYYGDLDGMPETEALGLFVSSDLAFLDTHPQCKPYHRPSWRELDVEDSQSAPWGYVWYTTNAAGVLQFHSATFDSSD